ncbi:MAG: MBL fold metallo-hydrolase [Candidatus Acidiferrales bacterium]
MTNDLIHEIIPVGMLQCNCSILGDPASREAIVVDPGDDVAQILEILGRHELKVRAIISTHTHIDHVGGLAALHRATSAPVLIHADDLELYRHLDMQAQWLGVATPETMALRDFVKEGDAVRWGPYVARVLHTPGHTPGSICLAMEKGIDAGNANDATGTPAIAGDVAVAREATPQHRLIAGDTLFQGSIGRTDLWGGSLPAILDSIRSKLLVLPEDTIVFPGHGDSTTIGDELAHNPFFNS